ncbi:unnamed protein product [Dicrocoelium dendriticum]|nr:unnamed protein product [Dicrocoelium dendriticum]
MGNCFNRSPLKDKMHKDFSTNTALQQSHSTKSSSLPKPNQLLEDARINKLPKENSRCSCDLNSTPFSIQGVKSNEHTILSCPPTRNSLISNQFPVMDSWKGSAAEISHGSQRSLEHSPRVLKNLSEQIDQTTTAGNRAINSFPRPSAANLYVSIFVYISRTEEEVSMQKGDIVAILNSKVFLFTTCTV